MYKVLIVSLFLLLSYGCAKEIEVDRDADYYKNEGDRLAYLKKYSKAAKWYEQALLRAESPAYAAQVQLSLADCYFLSGQYEEAIPAYEVYLDVYRDSDSAKLAVVRIGLAYFNLVKYASRDQTNTEKALKYLLEVKERYPDLIVSYRVDERIMLLRERLARKEMLIANYYGRILKKEPEILRLKYLIEHYSDVTSYYEEALEKIIRKLLKVHKLDEAKKYYELLQNTSSNKTIIVKSRRSIEVYEKEQAEKAAKEKRKKERKMEKEAKKIEQDVKSVDEQVEKLEEDINK